MQRALLIVMTIAILGALGLYVNKAPTNSLSNRTSSTARTVPVSTTASSATTTSSRLYKDGIFQGSAANTPYGVVQIALVISGGKITDVNFIQMPSDQGHSREVTAYAEPLLKQTTLQAQSANIEFVSGATSTSDGYRQSLQSALDKAAQSGQNTGAGVNSSNTSGGSAGSANGVSPSTGGSGGGFDE